MLKDILHGLIAVVKYLFLFARVGIGMCWLVDHVRGYWAAFLFGFSLASVMLVQSKKLSTSALAAKSVGNVGIIQRQFAAYNARNLEDFVSCFHPDANLYQQETGACMMSGHAAIKERYGKLFADRPRLHGELVGRLALGPYVVDHERVLYRGPNEESISALATYEVRDCLITRVWFLTENPPS